MSIDLSHGPCGTGCLICAAAKEITRLQIEVNSFKAEAEDYRLGADAEAEAGDEARAEVARLTAFATTIRKTCDAWEEGR